MPFSQTDKGRRFSGYCEPTQRGEDPLTLSWQSRPVPLGQRGKSCLLCSPAAGMQGHRTEVSADLSNQGLVDPVCMLGEINECAAELRWLQSSHVTACGFGRPALCMHARARNTSCRPVSRALDVGRQIYLETPL
ncbi:hypothetical protein SKAU_G00198390 [Synaphobranchus kaupii]|uniref:Uncharacterized protein n=1 Tax=Synaphobranchus kaupii TaxID=118154 RepID=A0A9Q1FF03_SYNKA|nr:hypothetical protein SKAU_G00198390 [Synaphobranchus kaupii]